MSLKKIPSLEIFKIKNFARFIAGRFFTTLAIQMQMTTIGLQIYYEYTHSAFSLGLTGLFEAIPFIAASFFSGYVSDNFNRKKIIISTVLALVLCSVLLFLVSLHKIPFLELIGYHAIFGIIICVGIIRAFFAATMNPMLSQLIDRELYTISATWNSTAFHIGSITGPILAAFLYGLNGSYHAENVYFINILLFFLGVFFFSLVAYQRPYIVQVKEGIVQSLRVGIRFVFQQKMLLSAIMLDLFAVFFGGAITILPAFVDQILHAGPQDLGLLRTAPAIGAVLMAFVLAAKPPAKNAGKLLLFAVAMFGVFTIAFGFCTHYWAAFSMLLLSGAFDNISVVIRSSIMQLATPDEMRGRVAAVNSVFIGSSNEIGGFESGFAAKIMGLVPSIIFGGGMTLIVVAAIAKLNPKLKKLDLSKIE
ncbi:MAG: MFS transporter [Bacteroidetes bacterium]|nr:MFS transporter [Bacteroidota bacterium]